MINSLKVYISFVNKIYLVFQITNPTTHIFTGGCRFHTGDSDNTPRPPIPAAGKCTSVNGNERILRHTPPTSSCELQVIPPLKTRHC